MNTPNIFHLEKIPAPLEAEIVKSLLITKNKITIERITSSGQVSPENFWYDQTSDEWVLLLQGSATIEFESNEISKLIAGNYLFIPAHRRHRILYTSSTPPCIWLAIHINNESGK